MDTITITVNGTSREVPARTTVRELLDAMGVRGPAAVERNRDLVPRATHASTWLAAGDAVEVVQLVGGG